MGHSLDPVIICFSTISFAFVEHVYAYYSVSGTPLEKHVTEAFEKFKVLCRYKVLLMLAYELIRMLV